MMQQYFRIKEENPDCLLMFRLGDFYEMFGEDAEIGSRLMDIVLTSREYTRGKRIPMCGVPHHALASYLSKLIDAGYKVAICDQVEDPKLSKGLVKREVTRIITPGTLVEDTLLESGRSNYLASISVGKNVVGISFIDMSSGEISATDFPRAEDPQDILSELSRRSPKEILLSEELRDGELHRRLNESGFGITFLPEFAFLDDRADSAIKRVFKIASLESVGLSGKPDAAASIAASLSYLEKTQKRSLAFLGRPRFFSASESMLLDVSTVRNLELVENIRTRDSKGTLFEVLDHTKTPMGRRLLRKWILQPQLDATVICHRLDAVQELFDRFEKRQIIIEILGNMRDIERTITRIAYGNANARDLLALASSLKSIPELRDTLADIRAKRLIPLRDKLEDLREQAELIDRSIRDDAPALTNQGGMIKTGFDARLDTLNSSIRDSRDWISSLEPREKQRTRIKSLKVGYNKVFGYYIEVSKTNLQLVPQDYVRKQTLVNCERFITPELEEKERFVLSAEEKIQAMESEILGKICSKIAESTESIRKTSEAIAEIDVLTSFSTAASLYGYVRPNVGDGAKISIVEGRHPVVERLMPGQYVPNDAFVNDDDRRFVILTGPNMAGKSTFMRQAALIVLMAQVGSFVPAKSADIGIVDRIFTRVGAFDDLVRGQSTFMVEMIEIANILNSATKRSLILLDEMGRGTSTFDGLSIAWAVTEYISDPRKLGAKTIFATHYHQLTDLAEFLDGVVNQCMAVREVGKDIVFLRKVIDGRSDRSYGIHVARLAGIPEAVLDRSEEVLEKIEQENELEVKRSASKVTQMTLFGGEAENKVCKRLKSIDAREMSPEEAKKKLIALQKIAKGAQDGKD